MHRAKQVVECPECSVLQRAEIVALGATEGFRVEEDSCGNEGCDGDLSDAERVYTWGEPIHD